MPTLPSYFYAFLAIFLLASPSAGKIVHNCRDYPTVINGMEALIIQGGKDTPSVHFDKNKGKFEMSGRSLPEDTEPFYRPVLNWLKQYKETPNPTTKFVFHLEYFNTGSSKVIMEILLLLKTLPGLKVVWLYNEDDGDLQEAGEQFAELVEYGFEFKSI